VRRIPVNDEQREVFLKAGIDVIEGKDYTIDEIADIEDRLGDAIIDSFEGSDYKPTEMTYKFEDLMDWFVKMQDDEVLTA
jgi:hypothetical protein